MSLFATVEYIITIDYLLLSYELPFALICMWLTLTALWEESSSLICDVKSGHVTCLWPIGCWKKWHVPYPCRRFKGNHMVLPFSLSLFFNLSSGHRSQNESQNGKDIWSRALVDPQMTSSMNEKQFYFVVNYCSLVVLLMKHNLARADQYTCYFWNACQNL